jgi:hypothetical protein
MRDVITPFWLEGATLACKLGTLMSFKPDWSTLEEYFPGERVATTSLFNTKPLAKVDYPDREVYYFVPGAEVMIPQFNLSAEGLEVTVYFNGEVETDSLPTVSQAREYISNALKASAYEWATCEH